MHTITAITHLGTTGASITSAGASAPSRSWLQTHGRHYLKTFKHYVSSPRWLAMYLTGRFAPCRAVAVRMFPRATPIADDPLDPFAGVSASRMAETLKADGFAPGLQLPAETCAALRRFAEGHVCYGDGDPAKEFTLENREVAERVHGKRFLLGRYYESSDQCETIRRIERSPTLRRIAALYTGARPIHIGSRMWWSFAGESTEVDKVRSGQGFHWDLDDYRALTFFFYLTEVTPDSGPHVVVRGSHERKKLRHIWSLTKSRAEAELRAYYGDDRFVELCGPAGFGFAENTFTFHKGSAPRNRDRLLLQVRFGIQDFGTATDRKPAA